MLDRYLAGRKRKDKTQPLFGHVLRHALRLQMEAQVALALEQGLRRSEILDLTIAAMHPDNSQLAVRNAKQLPGQNVKRMLPYSLHARKVVGEWLEFRWLLNPDHDSPFLALTNGQATQLEPQSLPQISAVIERAESTWRWHRLRHTAITMWLRAGVPLEKLQIFAGHTDIAQTLRYAKISEADVDEAFQAVEEKFNRRLGIAA